MNGTYNPVANFQQSIVTITRSGTAGSYITYKAYPGHSPKLQLLTGLNYQIWRAVAIDASYIIFTGIEIQGTNQSLDSAGAYQTWQVMKTTLRIIIRSQCITVVPSPSVVARPFTMLSYLIAKFTIPAVASALLIATMLPLRITLCIIPAGTLCMPVAASAFLTHEA
jgi:hypothetical protein